MSRLAVVERVISSAPDEGMDLSQITAGTGFTDGGGRQVAPLAWWLANTGRVVMSRDCTRWRPLPVDKSTCPGCGVPTVPRHAAGYVHRSYCLPCTEDAVGETYEDIRDRATKNVQGHAKKKWRVVA